MKTSYNRAVENACQKTFSVFGGKMMMKKILNTFLEGKISLRKIPYFALKKPGFCRGFSGQNRVFPSKRCFPPTYEMKIHQS